MAKEEAPKPCRPGAYRPVAGKIRELRELKGWSQIDLAERVGCSPRTIQNLESGSCSMIFMLTNIAQAFGVGVAVLHPSLPGAPEGKRVEVQLVLRIPYGDFDQTEQLSALVAVIMAILKNNRVDVVKVGAGSTVVTLTMSPEDAERFMAAMVERAKGPQGGGIWDSGGNWSGSTLPATGDDVSINLPVADPLAEVSDIIMPDDPSLGVSVRGRSLSSLR